MGWMRESTNALKTQTDELSCQLMDWNTSKHCLMYVTLLTWRLGIPSCSPSLRGAAGTEWPPCSGDPTPWRWRKLACGPFRFAATGLSKYSYQYLAIEAVGGSRRFSARSWRQLSTKDRPTQISVFSSASLCCTVCGLRCTIITL